MSIASLVLGIISVLIGWVPCFGTLALVPAIVGIVLGAVALSKIKKEGSTTSKSTATAGFILSIIGIVIIIVGWIIVGTLGATFLQENSISNNVELKTELNEIRELNNELNNELLQQLENFEDI